MIMAIVGLMIGACLGFLAAGLCHAAGGSEPEGCSWAEAIQADFSTLNYRIEKLDAQLDALKSAIGTQRSAP